MIEILCLILGILLVLLIFLDIVFTTYSMEGGGKLTDFFLKTTWQTAIWICGYNGRKRLLNFIGMLMMISLIFIWGLVFITLMVSYALPVLSKIIQKKQFSLFIHHLGQTPQELLLHFWNGKDFGKLSKYSMELQMKILLIGQSQKAYPILHYFHASQKIESLVITLCLIDEALSLLIHQISPDQWEEKEVIPLRKSLTQYLETMVETYQYEEANGASMPLQNLAMLTESGVNLVNEASTDHHRKELWFHILRSKGWTWKEVYSDY